MSSLGPRWILRKQKIKSKEVIKLPTFIREFPQIYIFALSDFHKKIGSLIIPVKMTSLFSVGKTHTTKKHRVSTP